MAITWDLMASATPSGPGALVGTDGDWQTWRITVPALLDAGAGQQVIL